jgi:hypothetical protein
MACVRLNPLVTSLSGRVGGFVFYMNGGNVYVRSYVVPRNPDTPSQRVRRALFAEAVQSWRRLSSGRKRLWNVRARKLDMNVIIFSYQTIEEREASGLLLLCFEASLFQLLLSGY